MWMAADDMVTLHLQQHVKIRLSHERSGRRSSLMPWGLSYIMDRIIHTEQVMNEELSYTWL